MLQSCSGHSSNTGDTAHGDVVLHFFVDICTFNPVTGLTRLCVDPLAPPERDELPFPFTGEGLSSFDFRFSGRGGKNAVGDGDGVFDPGLLLLEVLAVVVVLVFTVLVDDNVVVRPPRPFEPPFLNLLCTYYCEHKQCNS